MALEDTIALLGGTPLIGLLDREALRLLAFAAEPRNLRAGAALFREGERSDGGYVVASGSLVVASRRCRPEEGVVAGPGSLVGQSALFLRIQRPASATAREPSQALRISPTLMKRVLEEFPAAAATLHGALQEELGELTEGLERVRRLLVPPDVV